jgi:hypothetical protein
VQNRMMIENLVQYTHLEKLYDYGIRKVMVMRVFVAGGTGVVGRRPPRATQEGATK